MSEAGTKQALHNVFKSGKVYSDSLEKRVNNRFKALEKQIVELKNSYHRKLIELQIAQRKQLDVISRNSSRIENIITMQQEEIIRLKMDNDRLIKNQTEISRFIEAVIASQRREIDQINDRILAIRDL